MEGMLFNGVVALILLAFIVMMIWRTADIIAGR